MAKREVDSSKSAVDGNSTTEELSIPGDAGPERIALAKRERFILGVFREYLMTPGKMLCLSQLDRKFYGKSLANLVTKKLLIAECYKNGYSLTASGYQAMRDCQADVS